MTDEDREKANQILHQYSAGEIDKQTAFRALLAHNVMEFEAHGLLLDEQTDLVAISGPDDPRLRELGISLDFCPSHKLSPAPRSPRTGGDASG